MPLSDRQGFNLGDIVVGIYRVRSVLSESIVTNHACSGLLLIETLFWHTQKKSRGTHRVYQGGGYLGFFEFDLQTPQYRFDCL